MGRRAPERVRVTSAEVTRKLQWFTIAMHNGIDNGSPEALKPTWGPYRKMILLFLIGVAAAVLKRKELRDTGLPSEKQCF